MPGNARLPTEPYDRTILSLIGRGNINTTLFIIISIVLGRVANHVAFRVRRAATCPLSSE